MTTKRCLQVVTMCFAALNSPACDSGVVTSEQVLPPEREPGGPAALEPGRRVRRLTADQFYNSLQVATGEDWSRYDEFSAALGKADYAQITDEGTALSVTFDKLVHDAARETCKAAIARPIGAKNVIMRHADFSEQRPEVLALNLQYLSMRFLGSRIDTSDDPRIAPWLALLQIEGGTDNSAEKQMKQRWEAVCIGFATHPDFLTY